MSYDIATKFSKELEKFKIAIADEVHYLKNMKANRT